ncbi:HD domain-containing protein [Myxococcota bacterium]|nr:HD domain-containing protein [Myxococcota bacterium]MBU1431980.1 HD domain-containing protein [Myxococcota bacterium]MBU1899829.1 HD domain-containing protein [Myxococcota bacterium]
MLPKIMYVDDEENLLSAFKRVVALERRFEVITCVDPLEALELLKAHPCEVICSDYRMPIMNGLSFLDEARKIVPDAVRILITAHHEFEVAVDAVKVGVYRLIPKPWKREVLIGSLNEGVASVSLKRENDRLNSLLEVKIEELEALNTNLDAKVKHRTEQVIASLITCLDYRDEETMAHSKRVSLMSRRIAYEMGIRGRELIDIEWGAMLHDVGKIGVPDAILLKPGRLTEEEWVIMRRHVSIGYQMICHIDFLSEAARVVRDHHERFTGKGYPNGKVGEEIYIGARIFAVADTFDAITSDRPYRKAQSDQAAKDEIERVSGSQLDPVCVAAFMRIPDDQWTAIRQEADIWAANFNDPNGSCLISTPTPILKVEGIAAHAARG